MTGAFMGAAVSCVVRILSTGLGSRVVEFHKTKVRFCCDLYVSVFCVDTGPIHCVQRVISACHCKLGQIVTLSVALFIKLISSARVALTMRRRRAAGHCRKRKRTTGMSTSSPSSLLTMASSAMNRSLAPMVVLLTVCANWLILQCRRQGCQG